ncbi:hypothetical protein EW093_05715 [Thiospirochaeta perfilievii]|uniref:Uncharacterized protein n=1 Tax=Thiospirochaeta perfilievii TaxID=252967 RepID=A0A5C1QDE0_9SPIO|nr:hypothetical protein [Thiospirochaeta perfilievii]QEN04222.1 hypothetical protein EW093_05715 [Thiospirochaeta perfilievii]
MRGLIIVILINIGLFAYSQSIIDYKPLYPVINLLPLASNESCFIFINKEKKLVFETQISNIIKSSQLNLDRITLEKLINIEAPFYSPSTNANYCMIRTWGRKDYKDAWYILNYDKQEKIFTFNKYFETGFGGVQSPPIMRDSESNYTFFYEIEYDPFKSNEGTTFELKLSKKGSVSETIIKGQGAPSYNYIGNDLFL